MMAGCPNRSNYSLFCPSPYEEDLAPRPEAGPMSKLQGGSGLPAGEEFPAGSICPGLMTGEEFAPQSRRPRSPDPGQLPRPWWSNGIGQARTLGARGVIGLPSALPNTQPESAR